MRWAESVLADRGSRIESTFVIGRGSQGRVTAIVACDVSGATRTYALKVFEGAPGSVRSTARDEYTNLLLLHGVLGKGQRGAVTCPEPIALADELPAYLMTYRRGCRLDDGLAAGAIDPDQAASAIVFALERYHGATGSRYGDFTSDNVLVSGNRLVLIDPGAADDVLPSSETMSWMADDVGYWLQDVAGKALRMLVHHPSLLLRRARFARRLMLFALARASVTDRRAFVRRASSVARLHLRTYGAERSATRRMPRLLLGHLVIAAVTRRSARGRVAVSRRV